MTASLTIDLDTVSKNTAAGLAACFATIAGTAGASDAAQGSSTSGGAAQASGSNTSTSTSTAQPATTTAVDPDAAMTAKYFPADAGNAAFPSPENSRMIRNADGSISGRPYLEDTTGAVHRLVPVTDAVPNGYTVNGAWGKGGGSDHSPVPQLLVRQGKVFAQVNGGPWQLYNPGMGSLYNSNLPDPFSTDASGATTSTAPTSSVTAPADPTPAKVAPGSSGNKLLVGPGRQYATLTAAIADAKDGDTLSVAAGATFKEAPPCWSTTLHILGEDAVNRPVLDLTGLTASMAHGKGGFVMAADSIIENMRVTGTALDQDRQGTGGIRWETGCGYLDVVNCELDHNQNGLAGGGLPVVVRVKGGHFHDNGLGPQDGGTHNIYASTGTIRLEIDGLTSDKPNGGHAVKSRAFATLIKNFTGDAMDATVIDIPDGSVGVTTLDASALTKPAGSNMHGVIGYAVESANSGLGGMLITNTVIDAECDNPFVQAGNGSTITLGAGVTFKGTKPTADGTVKGL